MDLSIGLPVPGPGLTPDEVSQTHWRWYRCSHLHHKGLCHSPLQELPIHRLSYSPGSFLLPLLFTLLIRTLTSLPSLIFWKSFIEVLLYTFINPTWNNTTLPIREYTPPFQHRLHRFQSRQP